MSWLEAHKGAGVRLGNKPRLWPVALVPGLKYLGRKGGGCELEARGQYQQR